MPAVIRKQVLNFYSAMIESGQYCTYDLNSSPDKEDPQAILLTRATALGNLLKPWVNDSAFNDWKYFQSPNVIATQAFKQLPTTHKIWLVYTLLSGNEQCQMLAL